MIDSRESTVKAPKIRLFVLYLRNLKASFAGTYPRRNRVKEMTLIPPNK